ncbi:MAG: PaaI family thioesterase, partial [Sneathiella sp.]
IPEGFRPFPSRGLFTEKIGPLYLKTDGDNTVYGFLADESHTNGNGVVHGGMLLSFLDEVMGQNVWHAVDKKRCATITLNSDFVASAQPGDWIEARTKINRKGIAVVFVRGELLVGDKRILAADGIWKIIGK